ncbi:MAG: 3-deoxy-manno-octulosonate cytidylyltransferase [Candidatus Hydrogenedentota bacterium]
MANLNVLGVIPARYGSSRLPGKPLVPIAGLPMIQRVYERCMASTLLDHLVVATDDDRILDAVTQFGGNAVMTRSGHPSGTDRVAEAAAAFSATIVVNIQGDQPFISPAMIDETARPLLETPGLDIATLRVRITHADDLQNPGVVKVVVDRAQRALYFSRSLIPYPREAVDHGVYEHVGTYAYRAEALARITRLEPTVLERVEALEQLRWLEHGLTIHVAESHLEDQAFYGFSVDTHEDVARAEQMLRDRGQPSYR